MSCNAGAGARLPEQRPLASTHSTVRAAGIARATPTRIAPATCSLGAPLRNGSGRWRAPPRVSRRQRLRVQRVARAAALDAVGERAGLSLRRWSAKCPRARRATAALPRRQRDAAARCGRAERRRVGRRRLLAPARLERGHAHQRAMGASNAASTGCAGRRCRARRGRTRRDGARVRRRQFQPRPRGGGARRARAARAHGDMGDVDARRLRQRRWRRCTAASTGRPFQLGRVSGARRRRQGLRAPRPQFRVLDLEPLHYRQDAHVAEDDCLHLCIPGPLNAIVPPLLTRVLGGFSSVVEHSSAVTQT